MVTTTSSMSYPYSLSCDIPIVGIPIPESDDCLSRCTKITNSLFEFSVVSVSIEKTTPSTASHLGKRKRSVTCTPMDLMTADGRPIIKKVNEALSSVLARDVLMLVSSFIEVHEWQNPTKSPFINHLVESQLKAGGWKKPANFKIRITTIFVKNPYEKNLFIRIQNIQKNCLVSLMNFEETDTPNPPHRLLSNNFSRLDLAERCLSFNPEGSTQDHIRYTMLITPYDENGADFANISIFYLLVGHLSEDACKDGKTPPKRIVERMRELTFLLSRSQKTQYWGDPNYVLL